MCKKCEERREASHLPMDQQGIETLDKFDVILDDLLSAVKLAAKDDVSKLTNPRKQDTVRNRSLSLMASLAARIQAKMIIELYERGEETVPEMTSTDLLASCAEIVEENTSERLRNMVALMFLAKDFTLPTANNVQAHYNHLTTNR